MDFTSETGACDFSSHGWVPEKVRSADCATHGARSANCDQPWRLIDRSSNLIIKGLDLTNVNPSKNTREIPGLARIVPEKLYSKFYMTEVDVHQLKSLIEALALKTKQSCDTQGFDMMSNALTEWSRETIVSRYLSETLYRRAQNEIENGNQIIRLQSGKLNLIARFLEYKSYTDFSNQQKIDPILSECTGTYFSYIRRNTETGFILCSPVEIVRTGEKIKYRLKGPEQLFTGDVEFKNGCLFVLMRSENGKQFHHVYKIGQRKKPDLLRGIFSGVTTDFEPIAGRVVLIRVNNTFEELPITKLEISQLIESKDGNKERIGRYFEAYSKNNLGLNKPTSLTFGPDDLEGI